MTRILILGDYRQSLTIARSLAARGDVVIAGVVDGARSHVRLSRAVATTWLHPPISDASFGASLFDAIARFRPDVLMPVGDLEIRWVADRWDDFTVTLAMPDPEVIRICQSKPDLLRLAGELSIPDIPSATVSDMDELAAAAAHLGYPIFVKPYDTLMRLGGRKGLEVTAPTELRKVLAAWPSEHERLIVQHYVDGTRHNVYFAAERGTLTSAVEVRIDRTDTPDGTGLAVDGVTVEPTPSLLAQTSRLVRELKYTGVGCTQFLVTSDGRDAFLELNPRLGANFVVVRSAGLDLAPMAIDIALDRQVSSPTTKTNVRYAWALGELAGLRDAVSTGEIRLLEVAKRIVGMLRTLAAADVQVVWSWRDPLPALAGLWDLTGQAVVRRVSRTRKA